MTNDEMVAFVIDRFEGGYVDHLADAGGATNFGVTRRTLTTWLGRPATKADVKALTLEQAVRILSVLYLEKTRIGLIPDWRLRFAVMDFAIHSGPGNAIKALQTAVGVTPDGVMTPKGPTLTAVQAHPNPAELRDHVLAARLEFLGSLLAKRPSQIVFAQGWLRRIGQVMTV